MSLNVFRKRIISIFLIVCILCNMIPSLIYATEESSNKKVIVEIDKTFGKNGIYYDTWIKKSAVCFNLYFNNVDATHITVPLKYDTSKLSPAGAIYNRGEFDGIDSATSIEGDRNSPGFLDLKQEVITPGYSELAKKELDTEAGKAIMQFGQSGLEDYQLSTKTQIGSFYFIIDDSITNTDQITQEMLSFDLDSSDSGIYKMINATEFTNSKEGYSMELPSALSTPVVTSIAITTEPKKDYVVRESLDLTGMKVTATYSDTTTKELTDSEYTTNASELDLTTPGTKTLTVTYKGTDIAEGANKPTAIFNINVREKKITSIEFGTASFETSYKQGDTLNLSSEKITVLATLENETNPNTTLANDEYDLAVTKDGTSITIPANKQITLTDAGEYIITATYTGTNGIDGLQPATKTITIAEKTLKGIEVTAPTNDTYTVGEKLDLTGLTVTAKYDNNGIEETETITEGYTTKIGETPVDNETILTNAHIGVQTITVTYNGVTSDKPIDIVVFPTKLVGIQGQELSTVNMPEGAEEFEWVNGEDTLGVGEQQKTLKYKNSDKTKDITVLGIPTGLTATYGNKLSSVVLPDEKGFTWENPEEVINEVGENKEFNILYNCSQSYGDCTQLKAKVNVDKAEEYTLTGVTFEDKTETYDGSEKGITVGGTIPAGIVVNYTENKGTDAGEYNATATFAFDPANDVISKNYKAIKVEGQTGNTLSATLTIDKAEEYTLTGVTFADKTETYDGNEKEITVTGTVPAGIKVSYTNNTRTNAGNQTATATFTFDPTNDAISKNYKKIKVEGQTGDTLSATLTINKAPYILTGVTFADKTETYDGSEKEITVGGTIPAGIKVSYTNNTRTNAGNQTATATFTFDPANTVLSDDYDAIKVEGQTGNTLNATLTIEKAPYTLTGVTFEDKTETYDGSEKGITVGGTIPAGIVVNYTENKGTDAGEYNATATFAFDPANDVISKNYKAIKVEGQTGNTLSATLTIDKAEEYTLTGVTFADKTETYDGNEKEITVTGTVPAGIKVSYTDNKKTNAGIYGATATFAFDPANDVISKNYKAIKVEGQTGNTLSATLTIDKAELFKENFNIETQLGEETIIGIPNGSIKYGTTVNVTATPKVNGVGDTRKIKFYKVNEDNSASTIAVISKPLGEGMYEVRLNVNEGKNFFAADGTEGKPEIYLGRFTVSKEELTDNQIEVTNTEAKYDGTAKSATITITGDSAATIVPTYYKDEDETGTKEPKDAGTYTIKVDITSDKYGNISQKVINQKLTITPAEAEITVANAINVYGNALTEAEFNGTEPDFVNKRFKITDGKGFYETVSLSEKIVDGTSTNVGIYDNAITVDVSETNNSGYKPENYNIKINKGTYEITKKLITVQIGNTSSVYTGTEPTLPATSTLVTIPDGAIVGTDDLGITLTKVPGVDARDYDITATYTNANYEVTFVNGTYTITKATLGEDNFTSNIPTEDVPFDGSAVTIEATINTEKTPGAEDITITAENIKYYKKAEDGGLTLLGEDELPTAVGTYEVRVSTPGGNNYYPADGSTDSEGNTYEEITLGEFSIVRSTELPTITVDAPKDNTYNGAKIEPTVNKPEGTGAATITYYKKEDDGTETPVTEPIDAGTYIVKVATEGGENYGPMTETKVGEFTISPRPVTVTIDDKTSVYGNDLAELISNVTNGDVIDDDNLGITLIRAKTGETVETTEVNVGSYDIRGKHTNTNYDVKFVNETDNTKETGTYTITKRPITISIDNKESAIKDDLVELTYQKTAGTEIGADKAVVLKTDADINTVDTYDITVESTNDNYEVTFVENKATGTYTVKDKVKEITLSKDEIEADCGTTLEDLINGITYTVVYEGAGVQTPQALITDMITTTYNPDTTEEQTLTVTYTDNDANSATNGQPFTADLTVTLKDTLDHITATVGENVKFYEGQPFSKVKENMTVEAFYANPNTDSKIITDYKMYVTRDDSKVEVTNETKLKTGTEVITVEYTEDEKTVTTDITITVEADFVENITFNFAGNKEYNYGDSIVLGTSTVTRTWKSGLKHEGDTIGMKLEMLSIEGNKTFDFTNMNELGEHFVKVRAFGKTANNTFTINVNDVVTGIAIVDKTSLDNTTYYYGDKLPQMKIKPVWQSGKTVTESDYINVTSDMLQGSKHSMTTVADNQTVTVTYKEKTDTFTINVKDYVKDIQVINKKPIYKIGEDGTLNLKVKKILASDTTEANGTVTTEYSVSPTTIDTSTENDNIPVTVSYENEKGDTLEKTVTVQVINGVAGAVIQYNPDEMPKNIGDTLDKNTVKIIINKQDGTTEEPITMANPAITYSPEYNPKTDAEQRISLKYTYTELDENGEPKPHTIDVEGDLIIKLQDYVKGYTVTPPAITTYEYGENLNLAGATVSKVWASGKTTDTTEISGGMISEYSATTVGPQTIYVKAFGENNVGNFTVTVVDSTKGISMKEYPNKLTYTQGETIDVTGAVLNVTKSSGIKEIPVTKEMISGYDLEKTGTQVITVTYDGKQTSFPITVNERPKKPVTPTKPNRPTPPTPNKPSTNDTVKYTVTFVDYNGTVLKEEVVESGKGATAPEVETRDGYKFKGWDKEFDSVEEDIKVTAKYEKIVRAEVNAPSNMEVEEGEDIDLSDVTLTIRDEDGNEIDEIPVTEDMINGFDSSKVGTQTVTVTYVDEEGFEYTATFKVKVKASKPAEVLGVKDEVKDNNDLNKMILPLGIGAGATGLLLILLALLTRKNVEIYALTENGRKLVGRDKISKNNARIVLDGYEKQLENANIEIVLNKKITKKLDNETVSIVFNGRKATYKVTYEDNEEFIIRIKNVD